MRRPLWKAVATTAVIAALAVVALYIVQNRRTSSPEESERPMLVVLPFENLGSAEDEYFADGITEEITTQVANVSGLGVISRTSSIKYKDTEKSAKQIGEELGVGYILEGTIRWDQSTTPARVRINPQLIRVADDTHLWAESYDRELEHIFATQSDIARQVVAALNVTLLDREDEALAVKPTSNLKAYEAYLRGLEFINMPDFSTQDTRSAIRMFEEAVALDTAFAAAWAQLSQAYSRLDFQGVEDRAGLLDKSKAALDRALTINPELKEALLSAGILAYRTNRDYVTALQYFEHTRKLWPGDRETLGWIAAVYRRQGRFAQAVEQYQKAGTYDPLDSWVNHEIGWTYMRMRRYDEAIEAYDRSIELAPEQTLDYTLRATVYWFKNGDLDAARSSFSSARSNQQDFTHFNWIRQSVLERNFEGALELLGMTTDSVFFTQEYFAPISMYTGYVLTLLDREQDAREAFKAARIQLEEERSRNPDDHRVYSSLGIVQAYLGHEKEAIALGNRGIELFPIEKDAVIGPFRVIDLAHIYTILGEYGSAMDRIEYLMSIPCMLSIAILQLDPRWDSLRDHPRFQALIAKGDTVF